MNHALYVVSIADKYTGEPVSDFEVLKQVNDLLSRADERGYSVVTSYPITTSVKGVAITTAVHFIVRHE